MSYDFERLVIDHIEEMKDYRRDAQDFREDILQRLSVVETEVQNTGEKSRSQKVFDWSGVAGLVGVILTWLTSVLLK